MGAVHPLLAGETPQSAPEGIRTPNLLIRSQMLYPLSYGRLSLVISAAEARGFEPPVPFQGGQLISSEPHSAALARLLWTLLRVPDPLLESLNRRRHSVHSSNIYC